MGSIHICLASHTISYVRPRNPLGPSSRRTTLRAPSFQITSSLRCLPPLADRAQIDLSWMASSLDQHCFYLVEPSKSLRLNTCPVIWICFNCNTAATIPKKMAIRVSMLGIQVLVLGRGQGDAGTWVSLDDDGKASPDVALTCIGVEKFVEESTVRLV